MTVALRQFMRTGKRLFVTLAPLIGVVAACGGTMHDATQQKSVDQTPAYKQGYRIGYNAVLSGTAEDCGPRSVHLRKTSRLKTKVAVRDFVTGCDTGAADAIRTK